MKKILFNVIFAMLAFTSCKKDKSPETPSYTCTTCKTTPDAMAANNTSSKGIYKGVVIGSSGTIMFDIANNGTAIRAVMVIDGVTVNLTSAVTWVAGQPYVANFTGVLNGSPVTINLSVGLSCGTPTVTSSNIPGHPNATLNIVKETSSNLVECFEGTYTTTLPESGTFNIIILRSLGIWGGIARETGTTDIDEIDGTVSNNQLTTQSPAGPVVIGTLNIDQLTGSFKDSNNKTVTVTGRRTL